MACPKGVSKRAEDGYRSPVRRRRVGHGGPKRYFRESMATLWVNSMIRGVLNG
jgi:hypothetical protein